MLLSLPYNGSSLLSAAVSVSVGPGPTSFGESAGDSAANLTRASLRSRLAEAATTFGSFIPFESLVGPHAEFYGIGTEIRVK